MEVGDKHGQEATVKGYAKVALVVPCLVMLLSGCIASKGEGPWRCSDAKCKYKHENRWRDASETQSRILSGWYGPNSSGSYSPAGFTCASGDAPECDKSS